MKPILLAWLPLAIVLSGCAEKRAWTQTQQTDSVAAYDNFLAQHPQSPNAGRASQRLRELIAAQAYRHVSTFKGDDGAHQITVVTTKDGRQITAGHMTFLVAADLVRVTPHDAKFDFSVGELEFDRESFGMAAFVVVRFEGGAKLPARLLFNSGSQGLSPKAFKALFPDAPKSAEISLAIDPAVGATDYAGLVFGAATTLAVNEQGRLEAAREGVTATDSNGAVWASRSLTADGQPPFVFLKKS